MLTLQFSRQIGTLNWFPVVGSELYRPLHEHTRSLETLDESASKFSLEYIFSVWPGLWFCLAHVPTQLRALLHWTESETNNDKSIYVYWWQAVRKKLVKQYEKMRDIYTRIEYLKGLSDQLGVADNEFKRTNTLDLRDAPSHAEDKGRNSRRCFTGCFIETCGQSERIRPDQRHRGPFTPLDCNSHACA